MCSDTPTGLVGDRDGCGARMFILYNNRLGCLGSILLSIVLSAVLILALRSCGG